MKTTKPISTISFNSPEYLRHKLAELTKARVISFWAFIPHLPEDDEGGKKAHCHVYIEPSKSIQTDDLRDQFKEFDPDKPDKPKGCLTFNSSKFDPWYMYGLHDKRYLSSKSLVKKYHYRSEDFVTSDDDDLLCKVRMIDMLALSCYQDMLEAIYRGETWPQYFAHGFVPVNQVVYFQKAWYLLVENIRQKARENGSDLPVDDDGEIIVPFGWTVEEAIGYVSDCPFNDEQNQNLKARLSEIQ